MSKIPENAIKCLDKGFVRLVDSWVEIMHCPSSKSQLWKGQAKYRKIGDL